LGPATFRELTEWAATLEDLEGCQTGSAKNVGRNKKNLGKHIILTMENEQIWMNQMMFLLFQMNLVIFLTNLRQTKKMLNNLILSVSVIGLHSIVL